MAAKFEIKKSKKGFVFNLKAANGEIVATSEVYSSMDSCKNGIESVKTNAPIAEIEDQTEKGFATASSPKFEIYKDKKGEFRFRLKAKNGKIIATGEGYSALAGCKNGVTSIKKSAPTAKVEVTE